MVLTKEFWEEVADAEKSLRAEGKVLTTSQIEKRFGVSRFEAKCLRFSLKYNDIISANRRSNTGCMKKLKKRVLLIGDLHSGHMAGLTPPPFWLQEDHPRFDKFARFQRETWNWFANEIDRLRPFDVGVWNGDLIDGKGQASGGSELLTSDRTIQADMAVHTIRYVNAEKNVMTYGTPYHTGKGEDFESIIAHAIQADAIKDELNIDIGSVVFNVKHETKSSSVPYGGATQPLKDQLYQALWADFEGRDSADIIVRSHIHEYLEIQNRKGSVLVLPAMQGAMTKFGGRRNVKVVDYGFAYVDIYEDGTYDIKKNMYVPESQKSRMLKL